MNKNLIWFVDLVVPFGVLLKDSDRLEPFERWPVVLNRFLPLSFFAFWLFGFIPLVGGLVYMLAMVPLSIHLHRPKTTLGDPQYFARKLLLHLTVILIGFGGTWSFIGYTFLAEMVAAKIGWATSPFQTELAFYTLGSGVAGLLAIWIRGHLITAVVITKSIFWYGAAYVHIRDAFIHQNFAPYNVGAPLLGDLIFRPSCFIFCGRCACKSNAFRK